MILEIAKLSVKTGREKDFESVFNEAQQILSGMKGYISHELHRCIEINNQYTLLVYWQTVEDHTVGFRGSEQYKTWRHLLHHFYNPSPEVKHYNPVLSNK